MVVWLEAVSCSLTLSAGGKVFVCGQNEYGVLGVPVLGGYSPPSRSLLSTDPGNITAPALVQIDSIIRSISMGLYHALALSVNGSVVGWGDGSAGALGFVPTTVVTPFVIAAFEGLNISVVEAGEYVTLAIC